MCATCYTAGTVIGDVVLLGGPFAAAVVRKVRARAAREAPKPPAPAGAPVAAAPAR